MAKYLYTMKVSDFSGGFLPDGATPRARIRALHSAVGPDGNLAEIPIPVNLNASGVGTVTLVASSDTAPPTRYELTLDWKKHTVGGQEITAWLSKWEFTAVVGGGDIRTMGEAPPSAVFFTPNWPTPRIPGVYIDLETGNIYRKGI